MHAHVLYYAKKVHKFTPPIEGNTIKSIEYLATIPYQAPKSDQQTLMQLLSEWLVL